MQEELIISSERKTTQWVLWGALFISIFIYGFVGLFTRHSASQPPVVPAHFQVMLLVMVGISLVASMAIFVFLPSFFAKSASTSGDFEKAYFQFGLVRYVLSELSAILGLVLHFSGGPDWVLVAFLGWAVFLYMFLAPTDREQKAFRKKVISLKKGG